MRWILVYTLLLRSTYPSTTDRNEDIDPSDNSTEPVENSTVTEKTTPTPGKPMVAECSCNLKETCTNRDAQSGDCVDYCNERGEKAVYESNRVVCNTISSTNNTDPDVNNGTVTNPPTESNSSESSNETVVTYNLSRCETGELTEKRLLAAKILMILSTVWIIFCVLATMHINIMHKNRGHHRWIHQFIEIFIVILWLFMGVFNLIFTTHAAMCKATAIIIHISIVAIFAALLFEAIFADSMVHNKSFINGLFPPVVNYILPIILGLIPALITYFTQKNFYLTGLHCFATVPFDQFWGFAIPVWILMYAAGLKSSLGNLACDMTVEDEQDTDQIFWAKKSCKILFFFGFNLLTCYFTCLFGSSEQRLAIIVLFFISSLIFGPVIFISHTYCHINTSPKMRAGLIGRFYAPCGAKHAYPTPPSPRIPPPLPPPSPEKPKEVTPPPKPKKNKVKPTPPPPPVKEPPPPSPKKEVPPPVTPPPPPRQPSPPPRSPPPPTPRDAPKWNQREYYYWMDGKKNNNSPEDILFAPKPN